MDRNEQIKKYEETLQKAKEYYANVPGSREFLENIFPELRESEDERIRRKLIDFFSGYSTDECWWGDITEKDILAYLEKHKEQPKEKLGKYSEEENLAYRLNWVMQDYIKAGKDEEEQKHRFKCYKLFWDALEDAGFFEQEKQKLTQPNINREYLEERLRGLIDKKGEYHRGAREELAHLLYVLGGQPSQYLINNVAKVEQQSAEIDEEYKIGTNFRGLIPCRVDAPSTLQPAHCYHGKNIVAVHEKDGGFRCCCADEEKPVTFHLPEGVHFVEGWKRKPTEWSEEDRKTLDGAIFWLRRYFADKHTIDITTENAPMSVKTALTRLESLRPQPHWKPSEEQMDALKNSAYGTHKNEDGPALRELYNDLKKL